jgi:hypothetical protein
MKKTWLNFSNIKDGIIHKFKKMFIYFYDHVLTLLDHEAHHYTFGMIKPATRWCAQWSFHKFSNNKEEIIGFRMIFIIGN